MNLQVWIKVCCALAFVIGGAEISAVQAQSMQHIPDSTEEIQFSLTPSKATAEALPHAWAKVKVSQSGENQVLEILLGGLPAGLALKLFNIQVPSAPFGMAWYDGTVKTDDYGNAHEIFVGRFNADSFIVAPGVAEAPVLHDAHNVPDGTPDAAENPKTAPIHTLHLGLWFPSVKAAADSGVQADKSTPFNGKHNAGPLAFSSSDFPNDAGPLIHLKQP